MGEFDKGWGKQAYRSWGLAIALLVIVVYFGTK
jgi:hypothetical protein